MNLTGSMFLKFCILISKPKVNKTCCLHVVDNEEEEEDLEFLEEQCLCEDK